MADRFFSWFGLRANRSVQKTKREEAAADASRGTANVVSSIRMAVNTTSSVVIASGDGALSVTAYKRALDVLAGSVARLPFQFMKRKGDIFVPFESSPFTYLLSIEPQHLMSAYQWKYQMVWRALHDGDAYVWPRVIDGEVVELVLINRECCSYDSLSGSYYINDIVNGVSGVFGERDVIHIMFNSTDGCHGIPLWKMGARALSISATGDNETLERFAKGGNVRGIVSNDVSQGVGAGQYGGAQLDSLADDIEMKFKVLGRNIVGVPGDAKLTQFSMSSTDMQFLDSRKFGVIEISRLTGVPPVYLYVGGTSNYKEPQQTDVAYLTQTLDGVLCTIENEFRRKLVGRVPGRAFIFSRKHLFSMDMMSMADYYSKMMGNGIYTLNECRRMENLPPVPGGDDIYMSTNRAQLGSDKLSAGAQEDNNHEDDNE